MNHFVKHSPEEGAAFYAKNRGKYPFLDNLYRDSILPVISDCNYLELKLVSDALKGTPLYTEINEIMSYAKENFIIDLNNELMEHANLEKQSFKKDFLPMVEMGLDSIIHEDMDKLAEKYAGGILNYKKLLFFTGRNNEEFKRMWKEIIDERRYVDYLKMMSNAYLQTICDIKKEYMENLVNSSTPLFKNIEILPKGIEYSQSLDKYVKEFTANEKKEIAVSAIKDYVIPITLAIATGGSSTVVTGVYEVGSLAYDVDVTLEDIKNEKIDSDDVFRYMCENDLTSQIKNMYLDAYEDIMLSRIDMINKQVETFILKEI